jgi:hypothetical protein
MKRTFSYPPPIMDKATLAWHLSIGERTVDEKVKIGELPAGRMWGGKLMWIWGDVESQMLSNLGATKEVTVAEKVRHATRKAVNAG